MKEIKERKMTPRQKEFLKIILETLNDEHPKGDRIMAYRKAYGVKPYDTRESTSKKASKIWNRMIESDEVREVFGILGLTVERLGLEVLRGLKAMKTLTYQGEIAKDENGNQIDMIDHATRTATRQLLADILGVRQKHNAGNIMVQNNRLIVYVHDEEAPPLTEQQAKYKKEAEKRIHQARNYIVQENEEVKETDGP